MTATATINLTTTDRELILSGNTYPYRKRILSNGGKWVVASKHWSMPNTQAAYGLAMELVEASKGEASTKAAPVVIDTPKAATPPSDATKGLASLTGGLDAAAVDARIAAVIAPLMVDLKTGLSKNLTAVRDDLSAGLASELKGSFTALVKLIDEKLATERPPLRIEVTQAGKVSAIDGLTHYALPTLIKCLGAGLHVWLAGPSGSGKTHGAEQAAQALGLTFRLQGAMTMAHELTGFVDAGGKYHETPFVTSFRSGGLILLDELDAGSNEALLALNAALANGLMCLPSGEIIRAHKDFKCVGAANTFGAGATAEYVGRTKIDAAFLQRFGARITWGYDEKLETAMAGNREWAARVQRARKKAATAGLKVLITPRASQAGARMIANGMTPDEAANLTYLADLSPAQRTALEF